MLLLVDNYDSFTYNLLHLLGEAAHEVKLVRNDELSAKEALAPRPSAIIISPGPGRPEDAGICVELVRLAAAHSIPVLGICLGHQAIGAAYGARIVQAKEIMHGKMGSITHEARGIFADIPSPFAATRYHSLAIEAASLPREFSVEARIEEDGEIMAIAHQKLPIIGLQFHPESIATEYGEKLIGNFLQMTKTSREPHNV